MNRSLRYCLRVVSPIHIGCDEVYEPFSFRVDENRAKLVVFDPFTFLRELGGADRERFSTICRKGTVESLLEIFQFMRGKSARGVEIDVVPGLVEHYRKTLSLSPRDPSKIQKELNQFAILRTSCLSNDGRPYIPGSAVKGSLRTAYLNRLAKARPSRETRGRDLEKDLLDGGTFATDPFRMLKVSDFNPVGDVPRKICYAVNRKKQLSKFPARGPYQILEVIEPGAFFEGWISLEPPMREAKITNPIEIDPLLQSLPAFYGKAMEEDQDVLSGIGVGWRKMEIRPDEWPLRLGRHSGAESVTIEGHRKIKILKKRGDPAGEGDHSTTVWLTAESSAPESNQALRPFGWAMLETATSAMQEEFARKEDEYISHPPVVGGGKGFAAPTVEPPPPVKPPQPVNEIWGNATLTWSPGNQTLLAVLGNRKALMKGSDLIPEVHRKVLLEKRKSVPAMVEVEKVGNAFKIVGIKI